MPGAAVAGKQNSALVLVGVSGNGRFTAIDAAYGVGRPEHVHVLGGQLAVSPDTWSHLKGK